MSNASPTFPTMRRTRLALMIAALVGANAFVSTTARAAAVADPGIADAIIETHHETRIVTIDKDGVVSDSANGDAPRVVVAQSGDGTRKHIEKFSFNQSLSGLADIDVVVSSALSQAFSGIPMLGKSAMKNAPYSADVINERTQTLPDGNQLAKRSVSFAARDSAGRTRQEQRDDNGNVKSVSINDAVDGTRLILSPASKTATKINFDRDIAKKIDTIREKAKAMAQSAKDGKAVVIESSPGQEVKIVRVESPKGGSGQTPALSEEIKVNVMRSSDGTPRTERVTVTGGPGDFGPMVFNSTLRDGMLGTSFQDSKWSRSATTRDLGTKDIEGVRAEGKLRSYAIPAGEIGNKNPITVSTETWTSPELGITVYSKHSDPRAGDTIYRLANVKRTEQPLTLFTVPDGYSIKDTPGLHIGTGQTSK